jgi:PhnB protein
MASRLNPYISFNGNAREALEHYAGVLGGTLSLSTFGEAGAAHSPEDEPKIMHGQLETEDGLTLMASDTPSDMEFSPGNTMSVSLSGDEGDRLRSAWEGLSEGGSVTVPLEKQAWGDEFGMIVDRFGVAWMVNIGQPQG